MKIGFGILGLLAAGWILFSVLKSQEQAPQTHASNQVVEDYLWLEELEGETALRWVKEQNKSTMEELKNHPLFGTFKEQALELVRDERRLPSVDIMGEYVYNLWRDETNKRGLWRRMAWQDFITGQEQWETVLSIDDLAKREGKSWVWDGANCLKPDYDRCFLALSDGGKDATYLREFQISLKEFVQDGFQVPEAKSSVEWLDQDQVLLSTALYEEGQTSSGYGRRIQLWQRGQSIEQAKVIFEGQVEDVWVSPFVIHDGETRHVFLYRGKSFYESELHYLNGDSVVPLPIPDHAEFKGIAKNQLIFTLRRDDLNFQQGDVLSTDLGRILKGESLEAKLVFRPQQNQAVSSIAELNDALLIFFLDDVNGRIAKVSPRFAEGMTNDSPVEWYSEFIQTDSQGTIQLMTADRETNRILLTYENFLTPPSILNLDLQTGKTQNIRSEPSRFQTENVKIEQHFVESKDGTKVPYFKIFKETGIPDSPRPTLLYGYGGFEISLTPNYSPMLGKFWLERGGVYVLANIRGGGEYGPSWHQAALKQNRPKAFEDFIAVAEDLITKKITTRDQLAIMGGSNGGLLVGSVMVQRPDLFKAVICQVPLLDMLRYHKLLAGASWMAEYGSPDDQEMAKVLSSYSPFHNLRANQSYPKAFFVTSTKDDRVHPGHARRMAAKMMDLGYPVYYYENIEGGHSASADLVQRAERTALEFTYLWSQIGPKT